MSTTRDIQSKFQLKKENISRERFIIEGSFSTIFKGTYNDKAVALKCVKRAGSNNDAIIYFENEKNIFLEIATRPDADSYVVKFHGFIIENTAYWLALDLMEQDLLDLLMEQLENQHKLFSIEIIFELTKQILEIIEYLHDVLNIRHCDIKCENFLIKNGHLKICDFGFSLTKEQTTKTLKYTPGFIADEILHAKQCDDNLSLPYSFSSDIYAVGSCFYIIAHECTPESYVIGQELWDFETPIEIYNKKKPVDDSCPVFIAHLINSFWQKEPEKRMSASKAKEYLLENELLSAPSI